MVKIPFLSPTEQPPSEGRRIINRIIAGIFIFMGGAALIFTAGSLIFNSSLFIPRSADGVLKSIKAADHYDWSSESVRLFKPGPRAESLQQDAVRGVVVDIKNNKFVVIAAGVEEQKAIYTSDGQFTARLDEQRANDDSSDGRTRWDLVTDVCNQAPAISAQTVTMPSPQDLLAAKPKMDSDQGTVFGQRAWRMSFTVTPTIVNKLLLLDFFTAANSGDRRASEIIISDSEREAITNGQFKTDQAWLWVNRSGDRQIQQIDARITLDNGNGYRFLAQRTRDGSSGDLNNLDQGDPGC
jgi:hypothetical protein